MHKHQTNAANAEALCVSPEQHSKGADEASGATTHACVRVNVKLEIVNVNTSAAQVFF